MLSRWCLQSSRRLTNLVRVVEVGPRDGLQNVNTIVPKATKVELIRRLAATGLRSIEVTSFVSPKWVPQMADAAEVWCRVNEDEAKCPPAVNSEPVEYSALVPNEAGLRRALSLGVREIVLFIAASETFSQRNINCSIAESLKRLKRMREILEEEGCGQVRARGVISCVVGCPYEGHVPTTRVASLVEELLDMGCFEVALGDTVGVGTPQRLKELLCELRPATGDQLWRLAAHLHDTYGQALANVCECLEHGLRVFDASVAGLGGCPYAPGASGNLATEDLLYLLHGQGMTTGVDLEAVAEVGRFVSESIGQPNRSRAGNALLAAKRNCQQGN